MSAGRCDDCGAHGATYEFPNQGERVFVVAGEEVYLPLRLCRTCHERRWWNDPVLSRVPIERARDGRGYSVEQTEDGCSVHFRNDLDDRWIDRTSYHEPAPSPGFWTPDRVAAFAGLARRAI